MLALEHELHKYLMRVTYGADGSNSVARATLRTFTKTSALTKAFKSL